VPSDVACTYGSRKTDPISALCHLNYHHIKRVQFSAISTIVLIIIAVVCACLHIWGCCRAAAAGFLLTRVVFWVTIVAAAFALQVRGRLGDWDLDASGVANATQLPSVVCEGEYQAESSVVNLWVVGACLLLPLLWTIVREPVDYSFSHLGRERQRRRRRRNNGYLDDEDDNDSRAGEDGDALPSYAQAVLRLWRTDPEGGRTDLPTYSEMQPVQFVLEAVSHKPSQGSSDGEHAAGSVTLHTTRDNGDNDVDENDDAASVAIADDATENESIGVGVVQHAPVLPAAQTSSNTVDLRVLNTSVV
jgi:hypothetical protein